jgi:hypothetical protein
MQLEAPYDHLLSQDVVRDLVRLQRLDHPSGGVTSLVLGLQLAASLMDLEGLGAEIWGGQDAQGYVSALREEWDR